MNKNLKTMKNEGYLMRKRNAIVCCVYTQSKREVYYVE